MLSLDIQTCIDNVCYTFVGFDTLWSGKYTMVKSRYIILMKILQEWNKMAKFIYHEKKCQLRQCWLKHI